MFKKIITLFVLSFLITLILTSSVFALTGSIGNARMVLRVEAGERIEKSILVKNVNDVPLEIEVSPSGDLEENVEIKDDKFSLGPGEDRNARFTIDIREPGTTETRINIKFTPEEGHGVALSSVIIVIAEEENTESPDVDEEEDDEFIEDDDLEDQEDNPSEIMEGVTGGFIDVDIDIKNKVRDNGAVLLLGIMTLIIFVIFIVLLFLRSKIIKESVKGGKNKAKKKVKKGG